MTYDTLGVANDGLEILNGFQAMQGFLRVFGVKSPSGKFTIEV